MVVVGHRGFGQILTGDQTLKRLEVAKGSGLEDVSFRRSYNWYEKR